MMQQISALIGQAFLAPGRWVDRMNDADGRAKAAGLCDVCRGVPAEPSASKCADCHMDSQI